MGRVAPPPYRKQGKVHRGFLVPLLLAGSPRGGAEIKTLTAHLLVQSDVVDPDALFSSEEVGSVVAVLQHSPAVRRTGTRTTGVARTPKSEQAAGCTQTLRAGVVIIQKAWRHRGEKSNNGSHSSSQRACQSRAHESVLRTSSAHLFIYSP